MNNPLYLVAAFGITWGVLIWYTWRLTRRTHAATSDLASQGGETGREPAL